MISWGLFASKGVETVTIQGTNEWASRTSPEVHIDSVTRARKSFRARVSEARVSTSHLGAVMLSLQTSTMRNRNPSIAAIHGDLLEDPQRLAAS